MEELEKLKEELVEVKTQLESLIKDYRTFGQITNETVANIIQFIMQYQQLIEQLYSVIIKEGVAEKREIDELANNIFKDIVNSMIGQGQGQGQENSQKIMIDNGDDTVS